MVEYGQIVFRGSNKCPAGCGGKVVAGPYAEKPAKPRRCRVRKPIYEICAEPGCVVITEYPNEHETPCLDEDGNRLKPLRRRSR